MSDYYKTNTLGLPQFQIDETYKRNFFSCSLLNYQNLCVNIFNRFFIRTFFKDNKTKEGIVPTVFYKCSVGNKAYNL